MRRYLLAFSFLLSTNLLFSQTDQTRKVPKPNSGLAKKQGAFIDVNVPTYAPSSFNITQLVKDVLISSGTNSCVTPQVSNVQVTPNLPATNEDRAWGYFHRGTTSFPFKDGIVLVTGKAKRTGNDYVDVTSSLSDIVGTASDPDLVAATNPSTTLKDAVVLEFDFVPTSSQVKLNYLFASEEYTGSFPCNFSDAFALLLRPVSGGPYQNMAVLPGSAGPVSVTNIRPAVQFNGSPLTCGAINAMYFAGYNTTNVETNFNGRTIPLTATATVVAGQAYHFKMVIADATDTAYDSAVFLEGGSFNIGVELLDPSGATLPEEINVCDNAPQVITASVSDPNVNYKWYYNNGTTTTVVPGATTNSITAVQPGTYTVEVSYPGSPCPGTASIVINGGTTPTAQDATLLHCATPDVPDFDLNFSKPLISTTPGAVFRFYVNQTDAIAQNNSYIQDSYHYNGTDGQVLYVVVSNGGFCSKMVKLTLKKETTPTVTLMSSKLKVCPGDSVDLTATGGTTYQWSNFSGTGATQTVIIDHTTTFQVYAVGAKGCVSTKPATVTVEVVPEIVTALKDVEMCIGDRVTLDAGTGPNYKYLWSTGESTQTISVNQLGIYSVTIDNGYCKRTFSVKVLAAASPFVSGLDYSNNTLTVTANNPSINNIPTTLEYSIDGINWQDSNVFTGLTDNANYTVYVRTKGRSCENSVDFFTLHINNIITPNEDGINDVLDLTALGDFDNFTGSVYDRYGVEIFRFTKQNPIWNGTVGGKRLPTSTYWYKFNFQYPKSKVQMNSSGWIMLKNRE